MNIEKNVCEKLYAEVKTKLQQELTKRGKTFRGSETHIWKMTEPKLEKTYFQLVLEENTGLSFSATFNNMYLWRKMNEVQTKKVVNFQEDYLVMFVKFLGYETPQAYLDQFSMNLLDFFGIKKESKIWMIQAIFDANDRLNPSGLFEGKSPRSDEQTVDSRDTECLLEIIDLFHESNYILPKRHYDQDLVKLEHGQYFLKESDAPWDKVDCVFAIGFYSNYFVKWALQQELGAYIEFDEYKTRFRVRYYNQILEQILWSDYYESNTEFDVGFLAKVPMQLPNNRVITAYFISGIENKSTRSMTSYLCQNWKAIADKYDVEQNLPIDNSPFVMVFKVNKSNLRELYCQQVVRLE